MPSRRLLLVALIAFAAAIAGVFVGRMVSDAPKANETELHALLHGELDLTTGQETKLERIEADFSGRRRALELAMRAANVRLAKAIEAAHGNGQQVTKAVDETHEVMGGLQKETLQTLIAIRGVLNPGQEKVVDKS